MKCETVVIGGTTAIVCGRDRPRCSCRKPAPYLCDWKTGPGTTCDTPICVNHAETVAPNKHLCPEHSIAWRVWQQEHPRRRGAS